MLVEGLVYQGATIVQPLTPAEKGTIRGVLWYAVCLDGGYRYDGDAGGRIATVHLTLEGD